MASVRMYSTGLCPYCIMAEKLLARHGVTQIEKIRVDLDPAARGTMMAETQRRTVPQIFIGTRHVGGFDDLALLERQGELSRWLEASGGS